MTTPLRAAFRGPVPDRDGPTRRAGCERTTAVTRGRGGGMSAGTAALTTRERRECDYCEWLRIRIE